MTPATIINNLGGQFSEPQGGRGPPSCWLLACNWSSRQIHMIHTGWWFGTCFIFPYIGNNNPNWLIFFRGVQITNQHMMLPLGEGHTCANCYERSQNADLIGALGRADCSPMSFRDLRSLLGLTSPGLVRNAHVEPLLMTFHWWRGWFISKAGSGWFPTSLMVTHVMQEPGMILICTRFPHSLESFGLL